MKIGDMCYVKNSIFVPFGTPVVVIDIDNELLSKTYYTVLNPKTGERLRYQDHKLSSTPVPHESWMNI